MPKVIHTPNLAAIRFTGDFEKKLFELGGRKYPILKPENENIIIVTELQGSLLSKQVNFEKVDIDKIFVNKNEDFKISDLSEEEIEQFVNNYTSTNGYVLVSSEESSMANVALEKLKEFMASYMPWELEDNNSNLEDIIISLLQGTLTKELNNEDINSTTKDVEFIPPFLEDLENLSNEEIKNACIHFGITVGNKKIDTLKSLLIPFLKSKDTQ
ncbi:hypothetical protein ACNSOO_04695 [Aliarcobacter lanthieri]|uniref:hypothetical protein n=1 Tax=Aliarcobacter lanthieri TaxID=1355374 RepID=UPI003AABE48A